MKALLTVLSMVIALASVSAHAEGNKMNAKKARKECAKEHKKGTPEFKACVAEKSK